MIKLSLIILIVSLFCFSCSKEDNKQIQEIQNNRTESVKPTSDKIYSWSDKVTSLLSPLISLRDSMLFVIKNTKNLNQSDSLFALFRKVYGDSVLNIGMRLYDDDSFQKWLSNTSEGSFQQLLTSLGFSLVWSEGSAFVDIDSKYLQKLFGSYISSTMNRFLEIRGKEESEGFSNDAGLIISWNNLSERIIIWENFIKINPSFILISEAESWYEIYLDTYLTGMDNSPVFGYEDNLIDSDVKESYIQFLKNHSESKAGKIIQGYLNVLEQSKYKNDENVQNYLEQNKIMSMMGIQPPNR